MECSVHHTLLKSWVVQKGMVDFKTFTRVQARKRQAVFAMINSFAVTSFLGASGAIGAVTICLMQRNKKLMKEIFLSCAFGVISIENFIRIQSCLKEEVEGKLFIPLIRFQ